MQNFYAPLSSILGSFSWAIGVMCYAKLTQNYSASMVNFTRALIALPLFIIAAFATSSGFNINSEQLVWLMLAILSSYAIGDVLFFWSAVKIGVPAALAIGSCFPFWSALTAWIFNGEVLSKTNFAGLVLVVLGTITVILSGYEKGNQSKSSYIRGILLAFLTSLFWAFNTFAVAKGGHNVNPMIANIYRMLVALFICPVVGIFISQKPLRFLPMQELKKYWWIFVFEGFGGCTFFMYGLTHAPLAIATALSSLAPVISVPIAWALRTEKISLSKTFGIIIVVIGIWLLVGSY